MTKAPQKPTAKAIFDRAVEYYMPDQWEGYLVDACGQDEALRQRVRELLAAHKQSDEIFDGGLKATNEATTAERPGSLIGPYKLLQEIGEGGFGVVYMAEQTAPVRRKVALKIIKPGMDTKQVIARFEAERQALAMMDHPNIAKVLDAGATESGRPYFVMELVKGVPITEFCDTNKLSTHDRLELFAVVCRAVQHAHQKGVIHRDLKPSNVMVTLHDNKPMPVIIDFGVSKAISHQLTEKTLFTAYGQMVGTPAYMSPEQAQMSRMDIDTRSDIYSLGVLLYELLTGSTPIDAEQLRGTAYAEMQRMIREEEAPKPSTRVSTLGKALAKIAQDRSTDPKKLGQFLRGDLDWIVMKALDKERSRRYETANGLAMDIERFLNDEAVEACPPSMAYQIRKFVGRNRGWVTAASAVAAAALLGIIGTTGGMLRARMDARAARAARLEAVHERDRADALATELAKEADAARLAEQTADRLKDEAQGQVAKQLITRAGIERKQGDASLAALLGTKALGLLEATGSQADDQRRRLSADLSQAARPTQIFFHESSVNDFRLSPDDQLLAVACDDGSVSVWDSHTGQLVKRLNHAGEAQQVGFGLHGKALITTIKSSQASAEEFPYRLVHWDTGTWQRVEEYPMDNSITLGRGQGDIPRGILQDNTIKFYSRSSGQPTGVEYIPDDGVELDFFLGREQYFFVFTEQRFKDVSEIELMNFPVVRGGYSMPEGLRRMLLERQPERLLTGQRCVRIERLTGDFRQIGPTFNAMFSGRESTVAISSDGSQAAFVSNEEGIKIYQSQTGELDRIIPNDPKGETRLRTGTQGTRTFSFSPNNRFFATQRSNDLRVVDLSDSASEPTSVHIGSYSTKFAFSPDSEYILSMNQEGYLQLCSCRSGDPVISPIQQDSEVQYFRFSPDGRYVCTTYIDATMRVWDVSTGEPSAAVLKHPAPITTTRFSNDGSHVSVAAGNNVWLWPVDGPKLENTKIRLAQTESTNRAGSANQAERSELQQPPIISPDGSKLLSWSLLAPQRSETRDSDRTAMRMQLTLWDASTGEKLIGPQTCHPTLTNNMTVQFSPDGDQVLIASVQSPRTRPRGATSADREAEQVGTESLGHACHLWDLEADRIRPLTGQAGMDLIHVQFNRDGSQLRNFFVTPPSLESTSASEPGTEQVSVESVVYDTSTGEPIGRPTTHQLPQTSRSGSFLASTSWSNDGKVIAGIDAGDPLSHAWVSDLSTGETKQSHLKVAAAISSVVVCPDGKFLAAVDGTSDGSRTCSIWQLPIGSPATPLCQFVCPVARGVGSSLRVSAKFDPTSSRVAVMLSIPISVLRSASGTRAVANLPLSRTVTLIDPQQRQKVQLDHDVDVVSGEFSRDGEFFLTSSVDNVARIWECSTGSLVRLIRYGRNRQLTTFRSAHFSHDSERVIVRAGNRIRVWDVASAQPLSPNLNIASIPGRGPVRGAPGRPGFAGPGVRGIRGPGGFGGPGTPGRPGPFRGQWEGQRGGAGQFFSSGGGPGSESSTIISAGFCTPNADRFVLLDGQDYVVYDLSEDQRPTEELVSISELLSSRTINERGNVVSLDQAALKTRWEQLNSAARHGIEPPVRGEQWYRQQIAQRATSSEHRLWHLDRLIEIAPDDGQLRRTRGLLQMQIGNFDAALSDLDAATDLGETIDIQLRANCLGLAQRWRELAETLPTNPQLPNPTGRVPPIIFLTEFGRSQRALAYWLAGDAQSFQERLPNIHALDSFPRMMGSSLPSLLMISLLDSPSEEELDQIAELASETPTIGFGLRPGTELAVRSVERMVAVRRGHDLAAMEMLGPVAENTSTIDLLISAIAHRHLGHEDQSKQALDLAKDQIKSARQEPVNIEVGRSGVYGSRYSPPPWVTPAIEQALLREAVATIEN